MTEENGLGEQLRSVLRQAEREHSAAEEIFEEDTGADEVSIDVKDTKTRVTLEYHNNPFRGFQG